MHHLVLQPHLLGEEAGASATVVATLGAGLVAAAPARPTQDVGRVRGVGPDQANEQPARLGRGHGEQVFGAGLLPAPPFWSRASAWARRTAR